MRRRGTPTPGTVVTLPPNVPHGWQNIGDEMGQMFAIAVPGGCEQLFMDIAESGADTTEKIAVLDARLGIFNETTQALGLNST